MKFHLLLDQHRPTIAVDAGPEAVPAVDSLSGVVERLRAGQEVLRRTAVDDLIGLVRRGGRGLDPPGRSGR